MALINKISAVAEAVRERSGYTGGMTLEEMATEIKAIPYPVVEEIEITENGTYTPPEGVDGFSSVTVATTGSVEVEPIVLSGDCSYSCCGDLGATYINLFDNTVSTKDISNTTFMFYKSSLEKVPFDINFAGGSSYSGDIVSNMFDGSKIKELPKLNNCKPENINKIFGDMYYLREVPEDIDATWDWSYIESLTSAYSGNRDGTFQNCCSLRKFPMSFLNHGNPMASYGYTIYSSAFQKCYTLDEIIDLPFPHTATYTSNMFRYSFGYCCRLKEMTFATQEDGTPYVMPWKNQTIDLSEYVGYGGWAVANLTAYNSGITNDKAVTDDAKYAALKEDADWYTENNAYSRYNHDSAVNTINSLPDCSATGTNTIKFEGVCGSKTDGGAINTLTEEEIAVAAAKGWTVSLV